MIFIIKICIRFSLVVVKKKKYESVKFDVKSSGSMNVVALNPEFSAAIAARVDVQKGGLSRSYPLGLIWARGGSYGLPLAEGERNALRLLLNRLKRECCLFSFF
jgi:hypothetical protein